MSREEDTAWSNPRVLVIFAFIFLCGMSFGAVLMREYMHTHPHNAIAPQSSASNMATASSLGLEKLQRDLNLSEVQKQTVMSVLDDYGKFYQNIEDQRQDVAAHGVRRILDCLDEPQRLRFQKMLGMRQGP